MRLTLSLGRYRLLKDLGTGALTELRLGQMIGPQGIEHHVLQWIRAEQIDNDELVDAFFEQARLAAHLRHPNIVGIHEVVEEPGWHYVATEYVHGEDLRRVLARVRRAGDQVPVALLVGIAGAAAAGLHHAHALVGRHHAPLGILHHGVSPANILVGYDGGVKVAGFGVARAALQAAEARPGALGGLASYLSPEQVTGRPVDARGDVFALGVVMYELATARRLFQGANAFLTMSAIVHGEVPRPSRYRPDLPRALEDVILKALAPAPEDRYQSAEELRAALASFAHAVGMRISVASVADYMKKLFGERPLPWLADGAAATAGPADDDREAGLAPAPASARDELALPASVRRSPAAPIVRARWELLGAPAQVQLERLTGEPAPGEQSKTPLSWASQTAPAPPRGKLGLLIGAAVASAVASFFLVGQLVRGSAGGDASAIVPRAAPPPPPERAPALPPPPPPAVAAPADAHTAAKLAKPAPAHAPAHAATKLAKPAPAATKLARPAPTARAPAPPSPGQPARSSKPPPARRP